MLRPTASAICRRGALTEVLFGEVDPTGTLSVAIDEAGNPDAAVYPFGHGLTYGG